MPATCKYDPVTELARFLALRDRHADAFNDLGVWLMGRVVACYVADAHEAGRLGEAFAVMNITKPPVEQAG